MSSAKGWLPPWDPFPLLDWSEGLNKHWKRDTVGPGHLSHLKQFPAVLRLGKLGPSGGAVACWVFNRRDRFPVGVPYRLVRENFLRAGGENVGPLASLTPPNSPLLCPPAWTEPSLPTLAESQALDLGQGQAQSW